MGKRKKESPHKKALRAKRRAKSKENRPMAEATAILMQGMEPAEVKELRAEMATTLGKAIAAQIAAQLDKFRAKALKEAGEVTQLPTLYPVFPSRGRTNIGTSETWRAARKR